MSDRDVEVSIDVVLRHADKKVKREDIENRLYRVLADQTDGSQAYEAIADMLVLLQEVKSIASNKGSLTEKGAEVLRLLDLSTAKDTLKTQRNQFACALIASESILGDRPVSVIKDELTILMNTDIAEVGRVWTEGRAVAVEKVSGRLSSAMIEDLKASIADITSRIGKSTGK